MAKVLVHGFGRGSGSAAPTPPIFEYFLDDYGGAEGGYSLRLLREAYDGSPCITVRRDSDDTTQDIGFVDNVLDTASLATFVGAGSGYIRRWYDQSLATSNDLNQTTTARQPLIYSSGSIVTESGKPAIIFDGTTELPLTAAPTPKSYSVLAKSFGPGPNVISYVIGSTASGFGWDGTFTSPNVSPNEIFIFDGSAPTAQSGVSGRTRQTAQVYINVGDTASLYVTDVLRDTAVTFPGMQISAVGSRSNLSFPLSGSIQEVVLWPTDESSTQAEQYDNINNFY
jgi:hypothetical protein